MLLGCFLSKEHSFSWRQLSGSVLRYPQLALSHAFLVVLADFLMYIQHCYTYSILSMIVKAPCCYLYLDIYIIFY